MVITLAELGALIVTDGQWHRFGAVDVLAVDSTGAGDTFAGGLMFGLSQWSLERDSWGFYLSLGALLLGVVFYFVAQFGKKLGHEEMISLKNIIEGISWI